MALEMAQGMALSGAMIKAGMGSKTNTNNVLGVLAMAGGLRPTSSEYGLVAGGRLAEMWQGRCAGGDPIGCVGFATWGNPADVMEMHGAAMGSYWVGVGATVRFNSINGLMQANPSLRLRPFALQATNLAFGKAVAEAHLRSTERDRLGRHYFLSATQITDYHHDVFDRFGVSRGWYGGSYITGQHQPALERFYCQPSCDSN